MARYLIKIVILLIILMVGVGVYGKTLNIPAVSPEALILIGKINEYRVSNSLSAVVIGKIPCTVANTRMAQVKISFSHDGFFQAIGSNHGYFQENLARYFSTPESVLKAWIASPTHNKNLLSNMQQVCVVQNQTYWVMEGYKPL